MRAFVTGATGFIGSHLVERLLRADVAVAVLLRPNSNAWRIAALLPRVTVIPGDLHALAALEPPLREFAPDTLFHLAWEGVAGRERNSPDQIEANLMPTVALVRLAGRVGCRTWVGLGSQAEYGPQPAMIHEDTPPRPTTLYGVTKLCAGLLAGRLAADAGLRFAWLRVFSVYGPKDNPGWLLPDLIRALLRGERFALTACEQRWDYLYVTDAAEAIYRVGATPNAAGIFNLGSGQTQPLRTIVERVRDLIDPRLPLGFGELPYRPDQVMHLHADITRLTRATGWRPAVSLDDGLRQTIAWARGVRANPSTSVRPDVAQGR